MQMLKKLAGAIVLAQLLISAAVAQTNPGLTLNQKLTPGQWNNLFASKQDTLGFVPLNTAGGTMTGRLVTAPAGSASSGFNLPPGSNPASPVNGDIWTTSAGFFARINGVTIGPFISVTSPTINNLTVTGSLTATGLVTLADLAVQNANTVLLNATSGSASPTAFAMPSCSGAANAVQWATNTGFACGTIVAAASSIAVGTTTITSGATTKVLFDNAGVLGEYSITGTGNVVLSASPTFTGTPVLGTPTATSLALGGATIGGNALAVTGTALFNSGVTLGSTLTYGGVTLSAGVTGTGNMVLATSPTISGPTLSGPVLSGTVTGTYTLGGVPSIPGSAINSGTVSGSFLAAHNLASSGNGGVTGILPFANGGLGTASAPTARVTLNIDGATSTGDANYTILSTDRLVYHTALSAPRTDTLPAANSVNPGQLFYINDFRGVSSGTNTVTLQRSGADTINGVTSVAVISAQFGAGIFWSDGVSRWTFFPAGAGGGGTVSNVTLVGGNGVSASGGCTITSTGTCTFNGAVTPPQGRLTLAANTPVMGPTSCSGSACTNQGTLRYDCAVGGGVPYFNGSNDLLDTIASCEVTDAMVSAASAGQVVANNVYDVWWVHGGTNRICLAMSAAVGGGGGWASDTGGSNTARGTGYSQIDRITRSFVTNKNSITNCFNAATNYGPVSANQGTYLGTVYANGNGQVSYTFGTAGAPPTAGLLGVWNMYNRVKVSSTVTDASNVQYTYSSLTPREAHGYTTFLNQYVIGVQEDFQTSVYTSFGNTGAIIGNCHNSTSVLAGNAGINANTGYASIPSPFEVQDIGLNSFVACESSSAAGTPVNLIGFSTVSNTNGSLILRASM